MIPLRPPTSLPTSFYPHSTDAPITPIVDCDRHAADTDNAGVWTSDHRSASASRKGRRRRVNEDRVFAHPQLGIFGVCDGHGADSFPQTQPPHPTHLPAFKVAQLLPPMLAQGRKFEDAFCSVDQQVCAMFPPRSFIGTTVTAVHIHRGVSLQVAHVGDSRAMFIDANGASHFLTDDHSPTRDDEAARIEKAGGHVLRGRVNGVLAVSRAVGDRALKSVVPALPDVREQTLANNDQLLVLASDGLWDIVSHSEVTNIIKAQPLLYGTLAVPADLGAAAEALVEEAIARGSRDDTSVVLVDLRQCA